MFFSDIYLLAGEGVLVASLLANGVMLRSHKKRNKLKDELTQAKREISYLRKIDPVTGFYHKQGFLRLANTRVRQCARKREPISLLIVEIAGLDGINMRYSLKGGDTVLRMTAEMIRENTKRGDVVGRFDGSAIYVLLVGCGIAHIRRVRRRIERRLRGMRFHFKKGGPAIEPNFAFGACSIFGSQGKANILIRNAEEAMRRSKQESRFVVLDRFGSEWDKKYEEEEEEEKETSG